MLISFWGSFRPKILARTVARKVRTTTKEIEDHLIIEKCEHNLDFWTSFWIVDWKARAALQPAYETQNSLRLIIHTGKLKPIIQHGCEFWHWRPKFLTLTPWRKEICKSEQANKCFHMLEKKKNLQADSSVFSILKHTSTSMRYESVWDSTFIGHIFWMCFTIFPKARKHLAFNN